MGLFLEISGFQRAYSGAGICFIPGSMVNPSSSLQSCSGVRSLSSELFLGHLYRPSAARLYSRRNPSPSHTRALILSFRLAAEQKDRSCPVWVKIELLLYPGCKAIYPFAKIRIATCYVYLIERCFLKHGLSPPAPFAHAVNGNIKYTDFRHW